MYVESQRMPSLDGVISELSPWLNLYKAIPLLYLVTSFREVWYLTVHPAVIPFLSNGSLALI